MRPRWRAAWAVAALHCLASLEGPPASSTGRPLLSVWGVGASSAVPPTATPEWWVEGRRLLGEVAGCLTVTFMDSYGDGWNGAEMAINKVGANATVVWSGTLAAGALQTEHVCGLDRDACYGITVTAGSYPSEVSWTVAAAGGDGGATAAGGAPETAARICLVAGPTASPTLTPGPTLTPVPTGECWPPGTVCFAAVNWKEVYDGLGADLFDFGVNAGRFEVDLGGTIDVEATLKVGPGTTLVLKSTNGEGELNGGGARRVLEVEGVGASARLDGVAVKDGRHEPSGWGDGGGCIRVSGGGATLTLDGGAVVSGCEAVGADDGVRTVCGYARALAQPAGRPPPPPAPRPLVPRRGRRAAFRGHRARAHVPSRLSPPHPPARPALPTSPLASGRRRDGHPKRGRGHDHG